MRPFRIAAAIASVAAVGVAAGGGCYLPIATCEDTTQGARFAFADELQLASDDAGFRIRAQTFGSCTEFCQDQAPKFDVIACTGPAPDTRYTIDASGHWELTCEVRGPSCDQPAIYKGFASGRRPEGYVEIDPRRARPRSSVGAWLAELGRLEAASVLAFERLARELSKHGAPERLVRRARRSMRDEIVHARMIAALARRHGDRVLASRIARLDERGLEAIAIENAVEGCVLETLGAVVALHQAHAARAPHLRAAFVRIARDETRHAELAWEVDAWILSRLDESARTRVRRAQARAADRLDPSAIAARTETQATELGLPRRSAAVQMIAASRASMWNRG